MGPLVVAALLEGIEARLLLQRWRPTVASVFR
jgi:hypothetical protein